MPNRFSFVFTPTHASWLNIIECLFSKLARSFLRGIRVSTKEELRERILKYINELNQMPVVFKWKYKMDEIPGGWCRMFIDMINRKRCSSGARN
ncbi:MAG: transposase [Methanophagales archaeon]|nr:transposase [Methanophagales archaeon]